MDGSKPTAHLGEDPLARGARRAGDERAARAGTPLVTGSEPRPARPSRAAIKAAAHEGRPALRVVPPPPASGPAAAGPADGTPTGASGAATNGGPPRDGEPDRNPPSRPRVPRRSAAVNSGPTEAASARSAGPGGKPRGGGRSAQEFLAAAEAATHSRTGSRTDDDDLDGKADSQPSLSHVGELLVGMKDLPNGDIETIVGQFVEMMRAGLSVLGLPTDAIEHQVATTLAYLRRRIDGDFVVDEFGFDLDFTESIYLPALRPLYRKWFRVEVRGVDNLPSVGGALIVANHSGTIALDALMTQVAVHDEAHRPLRMLGADFVFATPGLGMVARRTGTTRAAQYDAERLLMGGELVGVWPEGFKGIGKPFSERYKLQRFGRGGFVSAAVRTGVPIIPCSIVGAEEIYPLLGNLKALARVIGLPYVPVTPTFPLLGPLGLIPLPSKWLIEFGEPVLTQNLPREAAEDPMLVFELTDRVRENIQQTLYSLLLQRRSVFF